MINNEILILLITAISLLGCLISYKLGRRWVEGFIITSMLSLYVIGAIFVEAFGQEIPIGTPLYAGIFLATDMLSEKYGKGVALRMVHVSVGAIIVFQILTQLSLFFVPTEAGLGLFTAVTTVADMGMRMMLAGVVVYMVAQTFDVKFYHFLHKKLGEKHLWLRNNLSTMTSQFIDTVLFFHVAFYGIFDDIWTVIWVSYGVKVAVAFLDTPFMYLSKKITPLDMDDAEKLGRVYK